ncbi:S41 family peptidase [Paraflavitalea pollutisoli]|uniref:S41 family peptidase n=1 Tax=Paraflavitalea pollutisoli TaxID=3034143 RepID=UPI0023EB1487|nr:S41 family peptidase [Paraflavitalea sp. H1-2-19X]
MKHLVRSLLLITFMLVTTPRLRAQEPAYDPARRYPVEELVSDLRYFQHQFDSLHPATDRYTHRLVLDRTFDRLARSIREPMTSEAFLSRLSLINPKIADGHTQLLPDTATLSYNRQTGRFFPFTVTSVGGRLYVLQNGSTDTIIHAGDELLTINGDPAARVLKQLINRQIRDGYNETYPRWIVNKYFSAYYSYCYGQPTTFNLRFTNAKGKPDSCLVNALSRDSIHQLHIDRYQATVTRQGIVVAESPQPSTAILAITTFDSAALQAIHQRDVNTMIDSIFTLLQQAGKQQLILDLRNNQGGDFEPGRHLLRYLIDRPVSYLPGSAEHRNLQPTPNRFTGQLFVLINGGSFSNTAIVCSYLQQINRAVFIGEETGGNPVEISGNATGIVLPHTQLQAYISTTNYRITDQRQQGQGLSPTYPVAATIKQLINGEDAVMQAALKLAQQPTSR